MTRVIDQYETEDTEDKDSCFAEFRNNRISDIKKLAAVNLILSLLPPAVLIEIEEELFCSINFIR